MTYEEAKIAAQKFAKKEDRPYWVIKSDIFGGDGGHTIIRDTSTYWKTMKPLNPVERITP